jgi:prevent-host-death family protein
MRYLPVEEARKKLGKLVADASSGEPVLIGRRGTEQAVLLSQEEYDRLRRMEEQAALARLKEALQAIRAEVRKEKLPRTVVDEAIRRARRR